MSIDSQRCSLCVLTWLVSNNTVVVWVRRVNRRSVRSIVRHGGTFCVEIREQTEIKSKITTDLSRYQLFPLDSSN
jgi:hypothetical protein